VWRVAPGERLRLAVGVKALRRAGSRSVESKPFSVRRGCLTSNRDRPALKTGPYNVAEGAIKLRFVVRA
jgi:hypothetical protein